MSSLPFAPPRPPQPQPSAMGQPNTIQEAPMGQAVYFQGNPNDKDTMLTGSAPAPGTGIGTLGLADRNYVLFNGAWTPMESIVGSIRRGGEANQAMAALQLQQFMAQQQPPMRQQFGFGKAAIPTNPRFSPNVGVSARDNPWEYHRAVQEAVRKGNLSYNYKPTNEDIVAASLAESDPTRMRYLERLRRQVAGLGPYNQQKVQGDPRWRGLYEWALQNNPDVARLYEQAFGFSRPQQPAQQGQQWV